MGSRKNITLEAVSILVFALGAFALVSLLTYRLNDPSLLSSGFGAPHNACGRLGAYFASWGLNSFGVGSFFIPFILFLASVRVYRRADWISVIGTLTSCVVILAAVTVLLALHWRVWQFGGSRLLVGGVFGTWIRKRESCTIPLTLQVLRVIAWLKRKNGAKSKSVKF